MSFNLLDEKWIPVQRRSGRTERIAPYEVTSLHDSDPVVSVRAPRVDFDGALVQFLIGLLQTTCTPSDEKQWRDLFDSPTPPSKLLELFSPVHSAFELLGEGPRFMQDLSKLPECQVSGLDALLLGCPGEITKKDNKDLFIKRDQVLVLCPACAAAAIHSFQTNGPGAGTGYRTGLRGGGPVTALPLGNTLWQTSVLGLLPSAVLAGLGNPNETGPTSVFPWLAPTRTSELGQEVHPADMHPCHVYWSMPSRFYLVDSNKDGICDMCGTASMISVIGLRKTNYGMNYISANWKHPLTPYAGKKGELEHLPLHMQPGGLCYKDAVGVAIGAGASEGQEILPPVVVDLARSGYREKRTTGKYWAFGVDFDNAKARGFYEHILPIVNITEEHAALYRDSVSRVLAVATYVVGQVKDQVRMALYRRPMDRSKRACLFANLDSRFWAETESEFWATEAEVRARLSSEPSIEWYEEVIWKWVAVLRKWAYSTFDTESQSNSLGEVDPARVALAWKKLHFSLSSNNNALRKELGLAPLAKPKKGSRTDTKDS